MWFAGASRLFPLTFRGYPSRMDLNKTYPIIDAHLDLAWNAVYWDRDLKQSLARINAGEEALADDKARCGATVCFPEMRRGGVSTCLATLLVRYRPDLDRDQAPFRIDLDFATPEATYAVAHSQLAYYHALEKQNEVFQIKSLSDLNKHWSSVEGVGFQDEAANRPVGFVLAMEGADPILSPGQAHEWWEAGLRCVNPVHYGSNQYSGGTGTDGPLTRAGYDLLDAFQELGMMVDVTHLSDPAFTQVIDHFDGPLLASHHNSRTLVPGQRQLTDEQIRLLLERGAVIGASFDAWMLYPGWERGVTSTSVISLETVVDHWDHICQIAGNAQHIAIGSDLDGGFGTEQVPSGLTSIADLQTLKEPLRNRGYSEEDIAAIFSGNWLRFLREHLP